MHAALHQNSCAAKSEGFLDLFVDDVIRQNISLSITFHAIKSAECAELSADICVVDIPVNDVADDVVRMQSLTNTVSARGQIEKIGSLKEVYGFFRSDPRTFCRGFQYGLNISHTYMNCSFRGDLIAPT